MPPSKAKKSNGAAAPAKKPEKKTTFLSSSDDDSSADDEPSGGGDVELKVNAAYASAYNERKRNQELLRMGSKLNSDDSDDDESDFSSEDERGDGLSPTVERTIEETIRMIREKDPRIYDPNFRPFGNDTLKEESSSEDDDDEENDAEDAPRAKPMTYKDMVRQSTLRGGHLDSEDEDELKGKKSSAAQGGKTYDEENKEAKEAFKRALAESTRAIEDSDEEEGFLKVADAPKTAASKAKASAPSEPLGSKLPAARDGDEAFLWNYVSSRAWMMENDGASAIPPSAAASSKASATPISMWTPDLKTLEEDEKIDQAEMAAAAEADAEYSYRYLEKGADRVVSHPRVVEGSLRRPDDARKLARARRKERKEEELRKKTEEIKRLKNAKRKMIHEQVEQALSSGGDEAKALASVFTSEDLDEDFDPKKWDEKMAKIYGDDYYGNEEDDFQGEDDEADPGEKPVFSDDDDDGGAYAEEEYEETEEDYELQRERDAKRTKLIEDLIEQRVDEEVPENPFPFRYRKVKPDDFGLTLDEILDATPGELNSYVPVSRLAPYHDESDAWRANPSARRRLRDAIKARRAERAQPSKKSAVVKRDEKEEKRRRRRAGAAKAQSTAKAAAATGLSSARVASYAS